jgi:hypothetical protein
MRGNLAGGAMKDAFTCHLDAQQLKSLPLGWSVIHYKSISESGSHLIGVVSENRPGNAPGGTEVALLPSRKKGRFDGQGESGCSNSVVGVHTGGLKATSH